MCLESISILWRIDVAYRNQLNYKYYNIQKVYYIIDTFLQSYETLIERIYHIGMCSISFQYRNYQHKVNGLLTGLRFQKFNLRRKRRKINDDSY